MRSLATENPFSLSSSSNLIPNQEQKLSQIVSPQLTNPSLPLIASGNRAFSLNYHELHLKENDFFHLQPNFLNNKNINKFHRQRLKSWLMNEFSINQFYRETYTLASVYLDLFLLKGRKIQLCQFQSLGIGCFVLAAKVLESRVPPISYQQFDKTQIFKFENQILLLLNFKLFPLTYVHICDIFLTFWDQYVSEGNCLCKKLYLEPSSDSLTNYRHMLQILDSFYLVPQNLKFFQQSLITTLFFTLHLKNCEMGSYPENFLEVELLLKSQSQFSKDFDNFLIFLKRDEMYFSGSRVDGQMMKALIPFLKIQKRTIRLADENKGFFNHYISVQTFNGDGSKIAKEVMKE